MDDVLREGKYAGMICPRVLLELSLRHADKVGRLAMGAEDGRLCASDPELDFALSPDERRTEGYSGGELEGMPLRGKFDGDFNVARP